MADPISLITANPDTTNPATFEAEADLAWQQLKAAIPQINNVVTAFNLSSVNDISSSSATLSTGMQTFSVSAGKSWVPGMNLVFASVADPSTVWLNGVVDTYSGTSLTVNVLQYFGTAGDTVSGWTISLSAPPQIEYENTKLVVTNGNGMGSTNTKIRRFSVVDTNTATADITYADSATLGATFTIVRDGWYYIKYRDGRAAGSPISGISLNSNQLTTNYVDINGLHKLIELKVDDTSTVVGGCETLAFLVAGDVLRVHVGTTGFNTDGNVRFEVRRVTLRGLGGGGGGGGGGGAPTDAGYIVTALSAGLSNERVLTGTATIIVDNGTANQTQLLRAAITGDVSIPAGSNVSTLAANSVANNNMELMAANTIKVNNTGAAAAPTDLAIPASTVVGRDATGNIIPLTMGTGISIVAGALTSSGGGGGGGAPTDAQYIVAAANGTLSAERVATGSTSITVNTGTASQIAFERAALTGDVTAAANSNALTIPNNTVTNAKAADMAANTIKANNTAALADPTDLAIAASRLIGRADTGNIAAIPLSSNFTFNAGTLSLAGVALWNGTIFTDTSGAQIVFNNGVYTWAAKPAANSVPVGTHIQIDTASFTGTHKHTIGPTAVSDGTRWLPAGGRQLLARGSGSAASPLATASGTTATIFAIAAPFTVPANFFEYTGGGLEIKAKFRKTGSNANQSVFGIRFGKLAGATANPSIAQVTTSAALLKGSTIFENFRVTALGAAGTASFVSGVMQYNVGTADDNITDKTGAGFDTTAAMNLLFTGHCADSATATHELVEYEVWWIA